MQDLQYTPSLCIYQQDTNYKDQLSEHFLFELTSTNKKYAVTPVHHPITPTIICLEHQQQQNLISHLKTQQFFQEFENNFIVTFDGERGQMLDNKAATKQVTSKIMTNESKVTDLQSTNASFAQARNKYKKCYSLANSGAVSCEKGNGIAFEVKKRTVFKAKENILNSNNFKLTKKKIINQQLLQLISPTISKTYKSQKSFALKKQCKKQSTTTDIDLGLQNNSYCNIFIEAKHMREQVRSSTLNIWRKNLSRQRRCNEDRARDRQNIFQPLSYR